MSDAPGPGTRARTGTGTGTGARGGLEGGGTRGLGGDRGLGLENWTVTLSAAWLVLFGLKVLLAAAG